MTEKAIQIEIITIIITATTNIIKINHILTIIITTKIFIQNHIQIIIIYVIITTAAVITRINIITIIIFLKINNFPIAVIKPKIIIIIELVEMSVETAVIAERILPTREMIITIIINKKNTIFKIQIIIIIITRKIIVISVILTEEKSIIDRARELGRRKEII